MPCRLKKILTIITADFFVFWLACLVAVNVSWAQQSVADQCSSLRNTPVAGSIWSNLQRCQQCGNCTLNDFVQLGVNAAQWILGIIGSLALLFFIYGGVRMLVSSGRSEEVQKAKTILTNAVIGLAIVFGSWMIINFAVAILTGGGVTIFGNPWYSTPK